MAGWRRAPGQPPRIYGHRGVRGARPENTLAAFEHAASEGADGIELDVRVCGSGELVVFHDPDLARMTGGSDGRALAAVRYDELRRLDLGGGAGVPRLSEVLAWARGRRLAVNVEVKGDVPDRLEAARRTVGALRLVSDVQRLVQVSSFHPQVLGALRALGCPASLALLFHGGQRHLRPWWVGRAMGVAALHPERVLTDPGDVAAARAAGRVVNVWTVNDEQEARDLAALGVDGLITDRPGEIGEAARGVRAP